MMSRFLVLALALAGSALPTLADGPVSVETIGTTCLETRLSGCSVLTAGFINVDGGDDEGAPLIAWQTQSGFTEEDGVLGGFILLENRDGAWTLRDSGFDGWRFFPPRFNEDGLLHIAGYSGGTGAYNTDRLYQWDETAWQAIDMETWRATIGERLPKGLEIWKGVQYDFSSPWDALVARTALWRADDGNCCPSGGKAEIVFAIEDNRLTVTDVHYTLPPANP